MGYEDDELKPYVEPQPDLNDQKRIGKTGTVQQQHSLIQNFEIFMKNYQNEISFYMIYFKRSSYKYFVFVMSFEIYLNFGTEKVKFKQKKN